MLHVQRKDQASRVWGREVIRRVRVLTKLTEVRTDPVSRSDDWVDAVDAVDGAVDDDSSRRAEVFRRRYSAAWSRLAPHDKG